MNFLVALLTRSHSELLRGEVACTLAAVVLGNSETAELLHSHPDFSYEHVLRLLYSLRPEVRLLAGIAIATFAFNSLTRQRAIAESRGVRWHNFQPFLHCADTHYQLNAAFQCVVLSRIIPDKRPASACALAIQTIVGTLEHSQSKPILALAADCVGCLAHTQAGIPAAIIAIDTVSLLCGLLSSSGEQVQGSAAIALGYLGFNHHADRQLLKRLSSLTGQIKYFSKCISPPGQGTAFPHSDELQRRTGIAESSSDRLSRSSAQTHSTWTTLRLSPLRQLVTAEE
ncbi:ankyrin and armadillo repeat-containing protein-like [Acipenser oxyrinchus oxyrinchus]|uniref:Ankyrin and armadillo repeat-containing protein-like n=1 Tax=Acipenser oxyrinchus oxyrinchus TaxID=40147 RepID=A0AAD8G2T6_ACIOX|nr:ankyrin and armadillo repeat-containing protein-like [Acipenser oxyrinchus oxyrinchus]